MEILLLDNYDSFTYNLLQLLEENSAHRITASKCDQLSIEEITAYDIIVLSPGPGLPANAGISMEVIKRYAGEKPILGVCLGMQAITEVYGGSLRLLNSPRHGIQSALAIQGESFLFDGISEPISVARYHSWVIDKQNIPPGFSLTAISDDGEVMAIEDRKNCIAAVQFHPESHMSPSGYLMVQNFFSTAEEFYKNVDVERKQ